MQVTTMRTVMVLAALLAVLSQAVYGNVTTGSSSGSSGKSSELESAKDAVEDGRYDEAIELLDRLNREDPNNADVLNLLGYSNRKVGNLDEAFDLYQQALSVDPKHRGANEYLGELYLETDQLAKAEERLAQLKKSCFFGCEEFDELEEAIDAYKEANGLD